MTTHTDTIQARTGDDCETATELQESWDRAASEAQRDVVGWLGEGIE